MEMKLPKNGTIVALTLTSGHRLIGELIDHKNEPPAIALQNVRPSYDGPHTSKATFPNVDFGFGEWWVECHRISKLEVLEEDSSAMTSSIVSVNNRHAAEKSNGRPVLLPKTSSGTLSVSWLTGRSPIRVLFQTESQSQLSESMQNYCKKLFDGSDFTRLLTAEGRKRENLLHIGLPKYFVNFHRELIIPIRYHESSRSTMDVEDVKAAKILEENANALAVAGDMQAGNVDTATTSVGRLSYNMGKMCISDCVGNDNLIPELDRNSDEENSFPSNVADPDEFTMDC